jgi:hypothetical protein
VVVIIAIIVVFLFLKRRRNSKTPHTVNDPIAYEGPSEKPEMDAGQVDPSKSGPVLQKQELHATSTPSWGANAFPDSHELASIQILEAEANHRESQARPASEVPSQLRSPGPVDATPVVQPAAAHADLLEEADLAVQELGLINAQKRRLTGRAQGLGVDVAAMPNGGAEEWAELNAREQRIRNRLDEIRRSSNG